MSTIDKRTATARRAALAALALLATTGAACDVGGLGGGPQFAVNDCVRIEQQIVDSDLEAAPCSEAVGTFDATKRTYRVDSIIDNTDGGCPQLQGFFPVEFVHEPDGVTYCLVQAD